VNSGLLGLELREMGVEIIERFVFGEIRCHAVGLNEWLMQVENQLASCSSLR